MTTRRSVLDRQDLYCPAPIVSGQASYGGVPKSVYKSTVMVAGISALFTLVVIMLWKMFFGSTLVWMFLFPVIITYIVGIGLTAWTRKRRDVLVILKESRKFEKKEQSL